MQKFKWAQAGCATLVTNSAELISRLPKNEYLKSIPVKTVMMPELNLEIRSGCDPTQEDINKINRYNAGSLRAGMFSGGKPLVGIDESGGGKRDDAKIGIAVYCKPGVYVNRTVDGKIGNHIAVSGIALQCAEYFIGVGIVRRDEHCYDHLNSTSVAHVRAMSCLTHAIESHPTPPVDPSNFFLLVDGISHVSSWIDSQEHYLGHPAKQVVRGDSVYYEIALAGNVARFVRNTLVS